eukprot:EG_transcript_16236
MAQCSPVMIPPPPPPPPLPTPARPTTPAKPRRCTTPAVCPAIQRQITALQWRGKFYAETTHCIEVAGRELRIAQHLNSERAGLGTGGMVWDAAVALCKFLEVRHGPMGLRGRRVVDLGSGTGIVGLCCAVLGAEATITDVGPVLQLIDANCTANWAAYAGRGTVRITEYRWGEPCPALAPPYDLVLASECIVPRLYPIPPLVAALRALTGPASTVLVAYEERLWHEFDAAERFTVLCNSAGLRLTLIPVVDMHPGFVAPGIHLWRLQDCLRPEDARDAEEKAPEGS